MFSTFVSFVSNLAEEQKYCQPTPLTTNVSRAANKDKRRKDPSKLYNIGVTQDDSRRFGEQLTRTSTPVAEAEKGFACYFCSGNLLVSRCPAFIQLSVADRHKWISDESCIWCLSPKQHVHDCPRTKACGKDGCMEKHHTLLHSVSAPAPVTSV